MSEVRTAVLVTRVVDVDGNEPVFVHEGDTVTSFRGEEAVFLYATRARVPGKSGKVFIQWKKDGSRREYYDKVFDLEVSGLLACGCPHVVVWDQGHQEGCAEYDK